MFIVVLAVVTALSAVFLHIGTAVVGVDSRSYGKAFVTSALVLGASWVLSAVLGFIGMRNGLLPLGVGVALNLVIIKSMFSTSWGKAFGAWLVQVVATLLLVGVPLFMLFGAALMLR